jgi:hypothetical protein
VGFSFLRNCNLGNVEIATLQDHVRRGAVTELKRWREHITLLPYKCYIADGQTLLVRISFVKEGFDREG